MRVKLCHKTVFLCSKVLSCIVWHIEKETPFLRGVPQIFFFIFFGTTFWQKILRIAHLFHIMHDSRHVIARKKYYFSCVYLYLFYYKYIIINTLLIQDGGGHRTAR